MSGGVTTLVTYLNSYEPISLYLQGAGNQSQFDEIMLPQVFPKMSFEQFGPDLSASQTINNMNDPYDVDIEGIQPRIHEIQRAVMQQQNLAFFAGRCLRTYTQFVPYRLVSRVVCQMLQYLDFNYAKAELAYNRFRLCVTANNTEVCKSGLRNATKVIVEDIQPAQKLLASSLDLEEDDLFRREIRFHQSHFNRA
ncbi:MAG: hypothetical protein ACHQUC_09035 [Chlamydiales bacterium]